MKNRLGQFNAIYPPAPLRRYLRRSIVEILVIGLEEPIINFVQLSVKHLLRKFVTMRRGIGPKENSVLITIKKSALSSGLAPQFADTCGGVHSHIGKAIEVL